ncbi:MAG: glycosyltransferase family 4 protein [Limnobacter sp.]|nr:glycosyltransferase family 4 protein [Limnobacter sp.]
MSTIFFTESLQTEAVGHDQIIRQILGLQKQGYLCLLLCVSGSYLSNEAQKQGIWTEHLRFRNAFDPLSLIKMVSFLRNYEPVSVISHSSHDSNLSAMAVHALHKLGVLKYRPQLIRVRNRKPHSTHAISYNLLFDYTLTPSASFRDQLLSDSAILPHKVKVLYPDVQPPALIEFDQKRVAPELQAMLDDASRRPLIAHVGEVSAQSGHTFMLDVVQKLLTDFPKMTYLVLRQGSQLQALESEVTRKGLGGAVFFASPADFKICMESKTNALVMPFHQEPADCPQLQALSAGIPLVLSQVGGLPEAIKNNETGYVCPPPFASGAVDAWCRTLSGVLKDPATSSQVASRGRESILSQFGLENHLKGLIALFQRVALPGARGNKSKRREPS